MSTRYRTSRDADGNLVIHDVPIFAECERHGDDYNREWILEAERKAHVLAAEGYYPPIHVRHHGAMFEDVRPAGQFRVTGVKATTFKGINRLAMFADLVITEPDVAEEIAKKKFPYRSVEIAKPEDPQINSLALLDHNAPYLEFPMLRLDGMPDGNVSPDTGQREFAALGADGVLAFSSAGGRARILIAEETMTQTTETEKPKAAGETSQTKLFEADKGKGDESEEMEGAEDGGMDVGGLVKAIESGSISVADMDAIVAAIQKQKSEGDQPETEDEMPTGVGSGAAAMQAAGPEFTAMQAQMAAMETKNAKLQMRLDERDASDQRKTEVNEAVELFQGRPMGSDLRTRLEAYHKSYGSKAFKAHVEQLSAVAPEIELDPLDAASAAAFAANTTSSTQRDKHGAIATKYQECGGEAVSKALHFSQTYDAVAGIGASREDFVRVNMRQTNPKWQPAKD